MMTFEEFQNLTTEQKLEVSMAHLAGVLHGQTRLTDAELEELRQMPSENDTAQTSGTFEKRGGGKNLSGGRSFALAGAFVDQGVSGRSAVAWTAKAGRISSVQERGAKSAARKPKPVKKA